MNLSLLKATAFSGQEINPDSSAGCSTRVDTLLILDNMASENRCLFRELPAELRLRIYEYSLAPTGSLALTSTRSKRRATIPVLAPALLATCRQIHSETAHILYAENSVCITVDARDTCWPINAETRLPQRVLERLQHMAVFLDCTNFFNAAYADVDWTAFCALVSLNTIRLSLITVDGTPTGTHFVTRRIRDLPEIVADLPPELLERIPASTNIIYGTNADSEERRLCERVVEVRQRGRLDMLTVVKVEASALAEVGSKVARFVDRGCRSGDVDDVYCEHREGSKVEFGAMRT